MKFGTEKEAALQQGWHKETHWWIKGPEDGMRGAGDIFDVTVKPVPRSLSLCKRAQHGLYAAAAKTLETCAGGYRPNCPKTR